MNDPQKLPEIQIEGHFCKMCAYDPMSPSGATPAHGPPFENPWVKHYGLYKILAKVSHF